MYKRQERERVLVREFKYLGSNVRCTAEIKIPVKLAEEAFNYVGGGGQRLLCGPLDTEFRKRMVKCFVLSITLMARF